MKSCLDRPCGFLKPGQEPCGSAKNAAEDREILALMKQEKDEMVIEKKLRQKTSREDSRSATWDAGSTDSSPWFRYYIEYDPAAALRKVTCPVLAINGKKDIQVPKQNLAPVRKALEAAGNKALKSTNCPA